jgi:excisionase family DNA binding protein
MYKKTFDDSDIRNENSALYDVNEAAHMLDVSPGTIRRWVHEKRLAGIKVGVRGDWRFTRSNLYEMVEGVNSKTITGDSRQTNQLPNNKDIYKDKKHIVRFYENDDCLIDSIIDFLKEGHSNLIIADNKHCTSLRGRLPVSQDLLILDANKTMDKFMTQGMPDADKFFEVIGGLVVRAAKNGKKVRIYGEIVALLWDEGKIEAALRLEELWNSLQETVPFKLMCGYPMSLFKARSLTEAFVQVCDKHSNVLPSESVITGSKEERLRNIALLQQKTASLEQEIVSRKDIDEQKDKFVALVSHELRTPLTSLKAFSQILEKKFKNAGDENAFLYIKKMNRQINKLTYLVNELLEVGRHDSEKYYSKKVRFDFDELVKEIIAKYKLDNQMRRMEIYGNSESYVEGNRKDVGRVISNLLSNAIKYSSPKEAIKIVLRSNEDNITLCIKDAGSGIADGEKDLIFERYFRGSLERQETYPGLGLGLYFAKQIIKSHGGEIWAESAKGEGSSFCFSLPKVLD